MFSKKYSIGRDKVLAWTPTLNNTLQYSHLVQTGTFSCVVIILFIIVCRCRLDCVRAWRRGRLSQVKRLTFSTFTTSKRANSILNPNIQHDDDYILVQGRRFS